MITTVTPNPCIDKTLTVDKFDIYDMNRATVLCSDPGGKGINVSRALKRLGCDTRCLGFNYRSGGSVITDTLDAENIRHDFIYLDGELRICTKLFDKSIGHTIEINEKGKPVSESDGLSLINSISEAVFDSDYLTLSGSVPLGIEDDFYYRCVTAAKNKNPNCRIVVDAENKLLLNALEASPYLIKPNIYEFQNTFGCKTDSVGSLDTEVKNIIKEYGLGIVCVSMGSRGAFIASENEAYFSRPAKVTVRSVQGAGDSMIAGIIYALSRDYPLDTVLRYGISAAGGSISLEGTGFCTPDVINILMKQDTALEKIR